MDEIDIVDELGHPVETNLPVEINLPGEDEPILASDVNDYVNDELYYYLDIYVRHKYLGPPFGGGWCEWPEWYNQLVVNFDFARAQVERERVKKGVE